MIIHPICTKLSPAFPIDQTIIRTSVRLSDRIGNCQPHLSNFLPPHLLISQIKSDSRKLSAFCPHGKHSPDLQVPIQRIKVDGFSGVHLFARKMPGMGWEIYEIHYNPGSLLYGHNGHVLTEDEFLLALSRLLDVVTPLLSDPNEWFHILPGVHPQSQAFWHSLEIPFHLIDEDGQVLSAFVKAKHTDIHSNAYNNCEGESISFANSTGELLVRLYRKDIKMKKKRRGSKSAPGVLRVEVKLTGDKLAGYLSSGTWKMIKGCERLISFRSDNLKCSHTAVMSKFSGVYSRLPKPNSTIDRKMGDFMGWIFHKTDFPISPQVEFYRSRYSSESTVQSWRNTKCALMAAARKHLEELSPVNLDTLFNAAAWNLQPGVSVPKVERMTRARNANTQIHPAVQAAYGSVKEALSPDNQ